MKEVVFASGEPDYLEDKHHSQQMVVCFAIEAVVFASEFNKHDSAFTFI